MNIIHEDAPRNIGESELISSSVSVRYSSGLIMEGLDNRDQVGGGLQCTGHAQWSAGTLLAEFILENRDEILGKTLVELGCGLGLCGLTAAVVMGDSCSSIVMTDGDQKSLGFAQQNGIRNATLFVSSPLFSRLLWGSREAVASVKELIQGKDFDVVLGGDLIYEAAAKSKLLFFTASLLLRSGGVFFLGFARREVQIETVLEDAKASGFTWSVAQDFIVDIFGNRVCDLTDFWQSAVFIFSKN
jgi:predicted nicotinamide N-methyase